MKIKDYYHKEYWGDGIMVFYPKPSREYKEMVIEDFKARGYNWLAMGGVEYKILKGAGLLDED